MQISRGMMTEIDPNNAQIGRLNRSCRAARLAWNWGLERIRTAEQAGEKAPGYPSLWKAWCDQKKIDCPDWYIGIDSGIAKWELKRLVQAYWARRKGNANGAGFKPLRVKGRKDGDVFTTDNPCGYFFGDNLKLLRIGQIRLKEHIELPSGAHIRNVVIRTQYGRWYVTFCYCVEIPDPEPKSEPVVGIDRGIKTFGVLSDGTKLESPRPLERKLKRLARLQRAASRKQRGSKNQQKAHQRVASLHRKIANERKQFLNVASKRIAETAGTVVLEDLNIAGMMQNKRLARHIADQGWGTFARMVTYKIEERGGRVVKVDRWFPSSKTCSACGHKLETLALSERMFRCPACNHTQDRDENAAANLKDAGLRVPDPVC